MGTVTTSIKSRHALGGGRRMVSGTITMSSSYATGGDTVNVGDLEMGNLDQLICVAETQAYQIHWNGNEGTPTVIADQGATEVTATTNLSSVTVAFIAFGTG